MTKNVISKIKELKNTVVPRSDWKAESRAILLRSIYAEQAQAPKVTAMDYTKAFWQTIKIPAMQPAAVMFMVLGTFVASSLTINAAFYSLPGDSLYQVKIALENTHVSLVSDEERKADLRIEFVQRRVEEINKIVSQPNVTPEEKERKIKTAVAGFRQSAAAVNQELARVAKDIQSDSTDVNKEQTVRIAITVTDKAEELAKTFEEKVNVVLAESSEESVKEAQEVVAEVLQSIKSTRQVVEDKKAEDVASDNQETTEPAENVEAVVDEKLEAQIVTGSSTDEIVE